MGKTREIAEYGDFQTPYSLAKEVCALLAITGVKPVAVLEPTCGLGSFLLACVETFKGTRRLVGADINAHYVSQARELLQKHDGPANAQVVEANFFATNWAQVIDELPEPLLVIGNPPWVTSSHLGSLGSRNVPVKSNFQQRNGFDAITGKANFDISEWMLIRLMEAMNGRNGVIGMLCKMSVARKVLCHGWKNSIALEGSAIHRIDASLHFDAAVEAALLVMRFRPGARDVEATVYPHLNTSDMPAVIGYEDDNLLADLAAYHKWKHLQGEGRLRWRSGVKHDCAKVMELRSIGKRLQNGLGESVDVEDTYVHPMLKSSDVANGLGNSSPRWMLVTQKTVGENTLKIARLAPRTWEYLNAHASLLDRRGSSIYRNRPPFSIFGVGDYTFAPWKVAISGFYKKLAFAVVSPMHGKPVVLDDTAYFLPCKTEMEAAFLAEILNSEPAKSFYSSFVFWDAKRPITAELLRRLDIRRLAMELGRESEYDSFFSSAVDFPLGQGAWPTPEPTVHPEPVAPDPSAQIEPTEEETSTSVDM